MDAADPPIPSPPSPSSFNHPTRLFPPSTLESLSLATCPLWPFPLRNSPSAPKEDDNTNPPLSLPPGDPSEVPMSTRKRPRNNSSSTTTPSSARRSSGGGSTSSSSSSSAMRRTTSLSDLAPPPEIPGRPQTRAARGDAVVAGAGTVWGGAEMMMRYSGDFVPAMETAAFLKACGVCKRRLGPGRDTFIYMGEVAFCSQECRQQQMNLDELMEKKCSTPVGSGGGGSDQSGKSSTVAAA